jgi:ubiquinone/menaquinone biosynthesis C-methylase UbiE
MDALDVGCGIGNHLMFLSEFGFNVWGIDLCKESIRGCIARYLPMVDKQNIHVADICSTGFEDESFDFVLDRACITYVQDKKIAIDEVFRILKPGGYFLCVMYTDSPVGLNEYKGAYTVGIEEIRELFGSFKNLEIARQESISIGIGDTIPSYRQYVIVARK